MTLRSTRHHAVRLSRRGFAAGSAALAAGSALAAEDALLQSLIRQHQQTESGQGFDSASRTILMPKASLPTLSAATAQTFKALNLSAELRLAQLKINLVRLRSLSGNLGPRFVVCNIPAAQIEAIENGVAVLRHTAVVGKPDRASPEINSRIMEVNFNPYWTVPVSIVRRDLIPKMQAEPDYLSRNHIRI